MKVSHKFRMGIGAGAMMLAATMPSPVSAVDPPDWSAPTKPFHIAGLGYYVGTKGLIRSQQGAILLDGPLARNARRVEHNIQSLGVPLRQARLLINDHAQEDHAGALTQIRRDSGARLLASAGDRWAIEHGTPRGDTDYGVRRFPPVKVDGVVRDEQQIRLGDTTLTAHLTPGHLPGCTSWSMTVEDGGKPRRVLFLCSTTVRVISSSGITPIRISSAIIASPSPGSRQCGPTFF